MSAAHRPGWRIHPPAPRPQTSSRHGRPPSKDSGEITSCLIGHLRRPLPCLHSPSLLAPDHRHLTMLGVPCLNRPETENAVKSRSLRFSQPRVWKELLTCGVLAAPPPALASATAKWLLPPPPADPQAASALLKLNQTDSSGVFSSCTSLQRLALLSVPRHMSLSPPSWFSGTPHYPFPLLQPDGSSSSPGSAPSPLVFSSPTAWTPILRRITPVFIWSG